MSKYEKIIELLKNESFPFDYLHKFIGLNSKEFKDDVVILFQTNTNLKKVSERLSGSAGAQSTYLAVTVSLRVSCADEVIELLEATSKLRDLKMIL